MPALFTARTRKWTAWPRVRPVTGYLHTFTGLSLHWTQWSLPASHLGRGAGVRESDNKKSEGWKKERMSGRGRGREGREGDRGRKDSLHHGKSKTEQLEM